METTTKAAASAAVSPYEHKMREGVREFMTMAGGIMNYAACLERAFERYCAEMSGYKRITTFANDFAIAEAYGYHAIRDTYRRAKRAWMGDYKYATELSMVLNWLCWFWYENKDQELSALYGELFYDCQDSFYARYETTEADSDDERAKKEEAVSYYFSCTD